MCFDIDRFVDKDLAFFLSCLICKKVLCCPQINKNHPTSKQEPFHERNKNGHKYCEKCIREWLDKHKGCPTCKKHLEIKDLQVPNKEFMAELKELKIKCKNFTDGCPFTDRLELIERHEVKCPYGDTICENCGNSEKYWENNHTEEACIKRLVKIIKMKDEEIAKLKSEKNMNYFNKEKGNETLSADDSEENEILNDQEIQLEAGSNETEAENLFENNRRYEMTNQKRYLVLNQPFINVKESGYSDKNLKVTIKSTKEDKLELIKLCATKTNHYERIKQLIELENANVNFKQDGEVPLIKALKYRHRDIAKLLIINKADVNEKNLNGETVLICAIRAGFVDIVKLLIENKASVNEKKNYGWTPLMIASRDGHEDIVQLLINNKVDVNEKNQNDLTALMLGYVDNDYSYPFIPKASREGHNSIVKLLVDNNADIRAINKDGTHALKLGKTVEIKKYLHLSSITSDI